VAALFDPKMSVDGLVALVRTEGAICARVLRVANSPFYGQRRRVTTVEHAFVTLGLDAVRGIATAVCLDRSVVGVGGEGSVDLQAMLRHGLATAVAAERLAQMRRPALAPDAFIAGLLHNLGIVVQAELDPQGIGAMMSSSHIEPKFEIRALESEHAAVGHEDCAASIFESWQLPLALVEAARHHHDPIAAPEAHRDLVALVCLGGQLACLGGAGFALEPQGLEWNQAAVTALGLTEKDLAEAVAELPERVAELRSAISGD
jgi:HD-like signal output (HDOD) protein